ncbi:CRISPR-associated protein, Cas5e family [Hydrogenimonas sp.]|nr:CRISPR-associated protein, Cas5e family [Hydrogenimonas sp.]
MPTLLMAIAGPMQSWGTRSHFTQRDTEREPSKSGIIGMVCAALGRDRNEPIDDLAGLKMGVRVDREGVVQKDYQTIQNAATAGGGRRTLTSDRWYLADAVFLVGLEGDREILEKIHKALRTPVWPLSLGRKSYVPSRSPWLLDGIRDECVSEALKNYPFLSPFAGRESLHSENDNRTEAIRFVIESKDPTPYIRQDQPISFALGKRKFASRYVEIFWENCDDIS